jgi:hypothetical protein
MKNCRKCGLELPLSQFYRDRRGIYSSRCVRCHGVALRQCSDCGKTYLAKSGRRFCSAACRKRHRPPIFRACDNCGTTFGPLTYLSARFCSMSCKIMAQCTGRKPPNRCTRVARRAQNLVRYHVRAGNIIRPESCQNCGCRGKRLEAAHYNYGEPLRIRWLCVSCHRRWDAAEPKGGVMNRTLAEMAR